MDSEGNKQEVLMKWTVHLGTKNPAKLAVSFLIILIVFLIALLSFGFGLALIASIILILSISEFIFPVKYKITNESASSSCLFKKTEINWDNVRNCYLDDTGVKLSPLETKSRLEVFRGVYLRFDNNKEQVIERVKKCRDAKSNISE